MMLANEVINMLMAEFDMTTAQKLWLEEGRQEGLAEGLAESREEGREEGLAEGREEGLAEVLYAVAHKLLGRNMPVDDIIEVTGLAREAVENLRDAG